jgi:hypothetical protein
MAGMSSEPHREPVGTKIDEYPARMYGHQLASAVNLYYDQLLARMKAKGVDATMDAEHEMDETALAILLLVRTIAALDQDAVDDALAHVGAYVRRTPL